MRSTERVLPLRSCLAMALLLVAQAAAGDVQMKTESWSNDPKGFEQMARRIESQSTRNLLARPSTKAHGDLAGHIELYDGPAGVFAGEGLVMIEVQPSVLMFYLGSAKAIHEIGF